MSDQVPNFQTIYQEFYPKILRYLTRVIGDKDEAEDYTQEVFIRVNAGLSNFEGRSSMATWIYKIATNLANDRFRSAAFQKGTKQTIDGELKEDIIADKNVWTEEVESVADQQLSRKEMNSCIRRYVDSLHESYKYIFILSEYEGLKNQEIASTLNLNLDTVKIRLHRARTQLKKKLGKGCEITPDGERGLFCDEK